MILLIPCACGGGGGGGDIDVRMTQIELFHNFLRHFVKNGLFSDTPTVLCSAEIKTGYPFIIKWRVLMMKSEKPALDIRRRTDRAQLSDYEYIIYKLRFNQKDISFIEKRPFTTIEETVFTYQDTENLMNHVTDVVYSFYVEI